MQTLGSCFDLVGSRQQSDPTQNRTTSQKDRKLSMKVCARGDDNPGCAQIQIPANQTPPHETCDYDSIDKEFKKSCRCLDKESEDRQNYPCTENMGKTM